MIGFRMNRIRVDQFAILTDSIPPEDLSLGFAISFGVAPSIHEVCTTVRFDISHAESPLLILELSCFFEIREEDWNKFKQDNKVIIPKELLAHFGVHTIGTARGILHCKTEGTQLNAFILPPINVSERITEDIIIEID